jgi:site-specific DNA-methyltransferase (adenine-specific)
MSRIVLGDCLSVLPTFPVNAVDFVLTDPPYLCNYRDRSGRSIANDRTEEWLVPAFSEIHRVLKDHRLCVSFYGWHKVDTFFAAWRAAGFRVVGHLVFRKSYASKARYVQYTHECAYLLAKGCPSVPTKPTRDVIDWTYTGNVLHPTQKPVEVLQQLIEAFSQPGDIVLDPFAGSGSTCDAARRCGRRYLGIELDPTYHARASNRLMSAGLAAA